MKNDEILARIAYDVVAIPPAPAADITIGMSRELYARLAPVGMLLPSVGAHVTLFGCRVRLIAERGLWWIVGYMGEVEEVET